MHVVNTLLEGSSQDKVPQMFRVNRCFAKRQKITMDAGSKHRKKFRREQRPVKHVDLYLSFMGED